MASDEDGFRNLPLKVGKNWCSIADVDKCCQVKCCLGKCHRDSQHLLKFKGCVTFYECLKSVSRFFQECFKGVERVFQGCFKSV